jgi:hypothetical protein
VQFLHAFRTWPRLSWFRCQPQERTGFRCPPHEHAGFRWVDNETGFRWLDNEKVSAVKKQLPMQSKLVDTWPTVIGHVCGCDNAPAN